MKGSHKVIAVLSTITIIIVTTFLIYQKYFEATFVLLSALSIFVILRPAFIPYHHNKLKITVISIFGFMALNTSSPLIIDLILSYFRNLENPTLTGLSESFLKQNNFKYFLLIPLNLFYLALIFIIQRFNSDSTVMGKAEKISSLGKSEKYIKRELERLKGILQSSLKIKNSEVQWSSEYYEDLTANVDFKGSFSLYKRENDLISAIRKNIGKKKLLVIGAPGAGKSTSLRKLAEDLLDEFDKTEKLPLYINLKEWRRDPAMVAKGDPQKSELELFIFNTFCNESNVYYANTFGEMIDGEMLFSKLLRAGRFYLIFDSFDEIPEILDANESSEFIKVYSQLIDNFIDENGGGRGLLSTRPYRHPSSEYRFDGELIIRPFTETQIISAISKRNIFVKKHIKELITSRTDIAFLIKNPFVTSLVREYLKSNDKLPKSQAELYNFYIVTRLNLCQERLKKLNNSLGTSVDNNKIIEVAKLIATELLENYGLEAPTEDLISAINTKSNISRKELDVAMELLCYSMLARRGKSIEKNFSFVHRRFAEYFLTLSLLDNDKKLPLHSITSDSKWREALALYTEVAHIDKVKQIYQFCWQHLDNKDIRSLSAEKKMEFIFALNFLSVSFIGRKAELAEFIPSLRALVKKIVSGNYPDFLKKIAVKAFAMLDSEDISWALITTLKSNNEKLMQTAIVCARKEDDLSTDSVNSIIRYVSSLPISTPIQKYKDLYVSLSLTSSLKEAKRWVVLKKYESLIVVLGTILLFMASPALFLITSTASLLLYLALDAKAHFNSSIKEKKTRRTRLSSTELMLFKIFTAANKQKQQKTYRAILKSKNKLKRIEDKEDLLFRSRNRFERMTKQYFFIMSAFFLYSLGDPKITANVVQESLLFHSPVAKYELIVGAIFTSVLFLFPWLPTVVLFKTKLHILTRKLSSGAFWAILIKHIILIILISALSACVFFLLKYLGSRYVLYGVTILMMFFLAMLAFPHVQNLRDSLNDKKTYSGINFEKDFYRTNIENEISQLKTEKYRLLYVSELSRRRINPKGKWKSGLVPHVTGSKAYTMLSELEEGWLNINSY